MNQISGSHSIAQTRPYLGQISHKTSFPNIQQQQSENLHFFFETNPLPMFVYDRESLRILMGNVRALEQYGYDASEFTGLHLDQLVTPHSGHRAGDEEVEITTDLDRLEFHTTKDGECLTVEVRTRDGEMFGHQVRLVVAEDKTEAVREHAELRNRALLDPLTGILNRSSLDRRIAQAIEAARVGGHKVAVLCFDIDRFKQINDWYGHATGDECLKQVVNLLTRRLRGMDLIARTGGEEFAIVLAEVDRVSSAAIAANMLLQAASRPITVDSHTITLAASIGIAVFPDHATEVADLRRLADTAMYRAKRAGGNQAVVAADDYRNGTEDQVRLEAYMKRMLVEGGFLQYYQLQYGPDGSVRGMEALLRLPHPTQGFIGPDRFIPLAEETGLIYPLGYWVLEQTCKQLARWNTPGRRPLRIAVNVSPLQLLRPDFAISVLNTLKRWKVDPAWIELEITERVVLKFDEVAKSMNMLFEHGVRFAVDDFGTGYSSLQHLNCLPISTVKIDRSFVQRLCEPNGSYPIVEAIIAMGHSLNMEVIAEGIETVEQRKALELLGTDGMQGFLFARPAPLDQVEAMLGIPSTAT